MYHLLHVLSWLLTTLWFRLRKFGRENIPKEGPRSSSATTCA